MTPTPLNVASEIAPLRCVVVHRPGDEVARMTQHQLDHLLFDDILSPVAAMKEHDLMTGVLVGGGAEVLDIEELLADALDRSSGRERTELLDAVTGLAGAAALSPLLQQWPAKKLAGALIEGVRWSDVTDTPMTLGRIRRQLDKGDDVALEPVPNLMFMRDPCFTVRDRVVVGRMATTARAREPLLVAFALRHTARVAPPRSLFGRNLAHAPSARLEGGDVMVLNEQVVVIGCSQRTRASTVERLARESLFDAFPDLHRVYAVMMPEQRSIMHLDTVMTQIDSHLFLGHRPLVEGERACPIARLERGKATEALPNATLLDVLVDELGEGVELVACGGDDPITQEREQWTDGANALCVGPGKIILYARNTATIAVLADHGFEQTDLHVVQPPAEQTSLIAEGMARPRTVFSFSGSELSRARGGGRCLTMPLLRG
jgi:arginine deiminase